MYLIELSLYNIYLMVDSVITFHSADPSLLDLNNILHNINLVVGDSEAVNTALLNAICMACLGPAIIRAEIVNCNLGSYVIDNIDKTELLEAQILAKIELNQQDSQDTPIVIDSNIIIRKIREIETFDHITSNDALWEPMYLNNNHGFFVVGYGFNRVVAKPEEIKTTLQSTYLRINRVRNFINDTQWLMPLTAWLPELETSNLKLSNEVILLINRFIERHGYEFHDQMEHGDYLISKNGQNHRLASMPHAFKSVMLILSDLLFNLALSCDEDKSISSIGGIVLINQIELHLDSQWKNTILSCFHQTFPNLQLIATTNDEQVEDSSPENNRTYIQRRTAITPHPTAF